MSIKDWINRWQDQIGAAMTAGALKGTRRKPSHPLDVTTGIHSRIQFWIGLLIISLVVVVELGWANPVFAAGDQPTLGDRYKSVDGYVTLSFNKPQRESSRPAAALRGRFVNQTPHEHWAGELQLNPALQAAEPGHRHGTFRDVAPGSNPQVVCTGEVDLQRVPGAELSEQLALAFKITGGKHCEKLLGDHYTVDFVAVVASDRTSPQIKD
jgi:hypothetical protein